MIEIRHLPFNPLATNCYIAFEESQKGCVIVDPGMCRPSEKSQILDMIRAETFRLPDAAENGGSGAAGIALVKASKPVFDRDEMEGF